MTMPVAGDTMPLATPMCQSLNDTWFSRTPSANSSIGIEASPSILIAV